MQDMVYTSKRGRQIIFDDFVNFVNNTEEYQSYWVEMCPHCRNRFRGILGKRVDAGGKAGGKCSVKGCYRPATYYVNFDENEVIFPLRIDELADLIVSFLWDYDPYEYFDTCDDDESAIEYIKEMLGDSNGIETIISFCNEVLDSDNEKMHENAKELLNAITVFRDYRKTKGCSYEKCLKCQFEECETGQAARKCGRKGYEEIIKELEEATTIE